MSAEASVPVARLEESRRVPHRWLIEGCSDAVTTLVPFLRADGAEVLGVDVDPLNAAFPLLDRRWTAPRSACPSDWQEVADLCVRERVDFVLPTWGERLGLWADARPALAARGVHVVVSPPGTVRLAWDKWQLYRFLSSRGIAIPATSLVHEHPVIKPRFAGPEQGIAVVEPGDTPVPLEGCLSQEYLSGVEFSVDLLCAAGGTPIHVVPRVRTRVEKGRVVISEVVDDPELVGCARAVAAVLPFYGPVNLQCFRTARGVLFTDVNPRIAGGLSVSLHATENWFRLVAQGLPAERRGAVPVRTGLVATRHLADALLSVGELPAPRLGEAAIPAGAPPALRTTPLVDPLAPPTWQPASALPAEERGEPRSETAKLRDRVLRFLRPGMCGVDLGYGGDPITDQAITIDLPERYGTAGDKPQHLSGDARRLHWFADGVLDYVYSSHLLEDHAATELPAILQEWVRVLKPGGLLILNLPDEARYREDCARSGKPYNSRHQVEQMSLGYMTPLLRAAGCAIAYEAEEEGGYCFLVVATKARAPFDLRAAPDRL